MDPVLDSLKAFGNATAPEAFDRLCDVVAAVNASRESFDRFRHGRIRDPSLRRGLARYPETPKEVLEKLRHDQIQVVRTYATTNPRVLPGHIAVVAALAR